MAKKILVIDDDPLIIKSVRILLIREGYIVEVVKNAKEGLEKGKNQDFDLIVCDIRMPELDGIELIKEMKEFRKNGLKSDIPVIFITGYASEDAPIDAMRLGAKEYILKPFDIDKLLGAIKEILKN